MGGRMENMRWCWLLETLVFCFSCCFYFSYLFEQSKRGKHTERSSSIAPIRFIHIIILYMGCLWLKSRLASSCTAGRLPHLVDMRLIRPLVASQTPPQLPEPIGNSSSTLLYDELHHFLLLEWICPPWITHSPC